MCVQLSVGEHEARADSRDGSQDVGVYSSICEGGGLPVLHHQIVMLMWFQT